MNKLKELFFGSKQDKLTDKAFTESIAVSVISILLCVVALCSVTWAWFSDGVSSSTNSIQSAHCDVSVSVTNDDAPVAAVDGKYKFYAEKDYTVTVTCSGTADSSYCILVIDGVKYYTEQMGTDEPDNVITFKLKFNTPKDNVEIITCWGTSSRQDRAFANGLYYVDFQVTSPETTVVPETTSAAPESTEPVTSAPEVGG